MSKEHPLFEGIQITELIPQRDPIIMVDTLYDATEVDCSTGLTISQNNIFCEEGVFSEPGLIEHIAQSASAFAGYNAKRNKKPTPIGFIGEVKKYQTIQLPKAGDKLFTTIHIMSEIMNVSLLSAETKVGDLLMATCQMKIFIKE